MIYIMSGGQSILRSNTMARVGVLYLMGSRKRLKGRTILSLLIVFIIAIIIVLLWSWELAVHSPGLSTEMVDLQEYIPGIIVDLKYARKDNVFGQSLYSIDKAYLRRGTAEKLKKVQEELQTQNLGLKVWDAYRPPAAQFRLWNIMPDRRFVVNPYEGFSYHSRGVAVDLTLVNQKGEELLMPSGFDDFSSKADRDYSDVSSQQQYNAQLLEEIMLKHGFMSIHYEWWHFADEKRDDFSVVPEEELSGR
ncbi:MAG: M15 family metallopeptidase [Syntrophomonadaceae bacterium]|nr:M15 family metallopeptidase [Syntrophomonadaceae bacterium]